MSNMQTEADVMRAAAKEVETTNEEINGELNRLQTLAEGARSHWGGTAQVSFNELMMRYDDAERRLGEALTAIAMNIRDNAGNYEDVEATNADSFSSIAPSSGLAL
ncbi:WXG100 family type VII secretion target [Corynebacterium genitalium ATCC 33030]|uniref:ESAT-6-like protein n=1 Tax=Corynebacterium genitalium ATCC 33030 TaxID=585529 RepID=D7WAS1_9CORY|nr:MULTISPECIES: WXG100 family type VII secretion target [Corynebacterium]MCQ4617680.1 WXG100 family type VII secretion target [Corynebacterium pseudogenitalium]EFK54952.1 WXG100 family type VII secretion target [Corynebacterium genitalium ATCC 33030]MCQ4620957.1 WXG100 family type VII secretion target [Corynebacterium sp. CCUG 71335]MCQ4622416.1 WXG100 family type VII secretion target [Corynebacterium sp. CCUG 70398]MCQ4624101.1 WXG100 family type VII secretion target [Corynebacterium sp. CCU